MFISLQADQQTGDALLVLRNQVNLVLEQARNQKLLGSALEAKVLLHVADAAKADSLKSLNAAANGADPLRYAFITSQTEIVDSQVLCCAVLCYAEEYLMCCRLLQHAMPCVWLHAVSQTALTKAVTCPHNLSPMALAKATNVTHVVQQWLQRSLNTTLVASCNDKISPIPAIMTRSKPK